MVVLSGLAQGLSFNFEKDVELSETKADIGGKYFNNFPSLFQRN